MLKFKEDRFEMFKLSNGTYINPFYVVKVSVDGHMLRIDTTNTTMHSETIGCVSEAAAQEEAKRLIEAVENFTPVNMLAQLVFINRMKP